MKCDSNDIADMVMWPKFGYSFISIREVIITTMVWGFDQKKPFFEGCACMKFNHLALALGMTLKVYTSVAKRVKVFLKLWVLLLRKPGLRNLVISLYYRDLSAWKSMLLKYYLILLFKMHSTKSQLSYEPTYFFFFSLLTN